MEGMSGRPPRGISDAKLQLFRCKCNQQKSPTRRRTSGNNSFNGETGSLLALQMIVEREIVPSSSQ